MSYEVPTDSTGFRLTGAPYLVSTSSFADFAFDGKPLVYFAPPPGEVRPYQSDWQTATDRQQVCSTGYGTSRPINTFRTQTSHQSQPLEATDLGLYWSSVAKKETVVSFSHGVSEKKEATTGDQWRQPDSKESNGQIRWDKSIEAQDQRQALPWNQPPERDRQIAEGMQSVNRFGDNERKSQAYLHPQPPLTFTFQEHEYQPQGNGPVYFQIREFEEKIAAVPVDSRRRFSFQSNRTGDQPVIVPWGIGQKAKDESVTGN